MSIDIDIKKCRTLILGDFNMDQMLPENIDRFQIFCKYFHFIQRSKYTTHNKGGLLDLVFDNNTIAHPVKWMPTPYSDHFILLVDF